MSAAHPAGVAPDARSAETEPQVRHYVWDRVVRLTHWTIALSMGVLAVTGFYIGRPFVSVPGEAGDAFVMGTFRVVHFYAAIAFTLAVLSRLLWMFVSTSRHARWDQFVPVAAGRWRDLWATLKFYLFIEDRPPEGVGHNPLAGAAYAGVFVLYLVMILTGLGLYGMQAHLASPLALFAGLNDVFGGAQTARWLHHVVMWLLLGFVVHHVYSAILTAVTEKNGTLESIFSGWKWFDRRVLDDDEDDDPDAVGR